MQILTRGDFHQKALAAVLIVAAIGVLGGCADMALAAESRGQWIAFAPRDFVPVLKPLVERRRQEGFEAAVISSTEVTNADFIMARLKETLAKDRAKACVLLAGAPPLVASLRGSVERMAGQGTDAGYGLPDADGAPTIAVGRFPAQSRAELQSMVAKTLRFEEDRPPAAWREELFLMVGNLGGGMLSELYVQGMLDMDLQRLDPKWSVRTLLNASSSRFFYPPRAAARAAQGMSESGALFSIYLGHSNARGTDFLGRDRFRSMSIAHGAGPFFTCGCFALKSGGRDAGYGLEAMRNPSGPSAVIGPTGESYSAGGQLAAEGLLACFARAQAPERLGDYWLATAAGLARGKMEAAMYSLLDAADGTHGKESLETFRREHLQMWMLLGDPAMRMPVLAEDVTIETAGDVGPGKVLTVRGVLPKRLEGAKVSIALERPANSQPTGLNAVPLANAENQQDAARIIASNNACANNYVIATTETAAKGNLFSTTVTLPDSLPWETVVTKVLAARENETGAGTRVLNVRGKLPPP